MDETVKTLLLIVGAIILCALGWGAWLVVIGLAVIIILFLLLYVHIDDRKQKKQQQRQDYIRSTFPLAYQKFTREHKVRFNFDDWWKGEQLESFFSVKEEEWATMQKQEEKRVADEKARLVEIDKQFSEIEKSYPIGLEYWLKKNNYHVRWRTESHSDVLNITSQKEPHAIDKADVLAATDQIQTYEVGYPRIEAFSKWEKEQRHFSELLCEVVKIGIPKKVISSNRIVNYTIPGIAEEDGRRTFSIYFTYFRPICLDETLDYSLHPSIKYYSEQIKNGFSEERNSLVGIKDAFEYYCLRLSNLVHGFCIGPFDDSVDFEVSIVFFDEVGYLELDPSLLSFIRNYFSSKFDNSGYCTVYDLKDVLSHNAPELKKHIILIGSVINTSQLKEQSLQILSLFPDSLPCIYAMSIYYEYSSKEMGYLIKLKKERIEAEEEKKRQEQILLDSIPTKIQNWESLRGDLRIKYLIDYYPTTAEFEADDEEWENRWLVWHFKNDPDKTSEEEHRNALNRVIPKFVELLTDTFGQEALGHLTLVCIPASTQKKNEARYKVFSEELCQRTGIENGYGFTQVLRDRTAQHEGGNRNNVNYSFDDSFFNGKRVILFDDIITKGDSMHAAKSKLEAIGAIVICGLAIGKTRHEHRESDE